MKKNSKKNNPRRKRDLSDEDRVLNSELGNFGLEPPKIYKKNRTSSSAGFDLDDFSSYGRRGRENYSGDIKPGRKNGAAREKPSRSAQKKAKKGRRTNTKSRKIIFYTLLTVLIIAAAAALSLTVLFKIHTITVTGNAVYSKNEIISVLPIKKESNLFMIDKSEAAEKLEESLPYIYDVEIKRKLPSTLSVAVTETPQVYYIQNSDKSYTYLDGKMKVLETHGGAVPDGAIEIRSAQLKYPIAGRTAEFGGKKTKENLLRLTRTISDMKLEGITAVYSEDVNNNYLVYDGRITIRLGSFDKLERKIYASLAAAEKIDETNGKAKGTITATDDKQVYFTEE